MKKITLSVLAAGMLFGADLMAARPVLTGSISIAGTDTTEPDGVANKVTVANELISAVSNGATNIPDVDIGALDTNGDGTNAFLVFTANVDGSGTVSDPTFKYTFQGNFDIENSNLLSGGAANNAIVIREYDSTANTILETDIATLNNVDTSVSGQVELTFQGNSTNDAFSGRQYVIYDTTSDLPASLPFNIDSSIDQGSITVNLYSTSGTEEQVTTASISPFETKAQYSVVCYSKLDGLINFENNWFTFVPTNHGTDTSATINAAYVPAADGIPDFTVDTMAFDITNNAAANSIEFGIDGQGSQLVLTAVDATSTDPMYAAIATATSIVINAQTAEAVSDPLAQITGTNQLYYQFNTPIPTGTTRYTAFVYTDMSKPLKATKWQAQLFLDDTAGITPGNPGDALPTPDANPNPADIGEWKDYVYIAQIAGATNDEITKTKLFITNRGCQTVTPTITFIYGGKTVDLKAPAIDPDTQAKIVLDDILDSTTNAAALAAAGIPTRGRYAIEITIPGTPEDFYVYAQAQSRTEVAATKDLPVYNTSERN